MAPMSVREAWRIVHDHKPPLKVGVIERVREAWGVINRFGIYGDTLKEMENGERYEAVRDRIAEDL